MVTGEPGIGKTWLVKQFLEDVGKDSTVLVGTCDDLTIPRPLGPVRDLAGSVSEALSTALSRGAAPHDIQALLIEELETQPPPTVLVIEDVHWADDATLDLITVLGRRIGSLPALLVLTFRAGEAPPGHRLHATVGAIRAEDTVVVELPPLSERAVTALAGHGADKVYAATGGNPFYVTEMLAARDAVELPPSVANAVLGRASRLDEAARHLGARCNRAEPGQHFAVGRCDAGLGQGSGGARATPVARGGPGVRSFPPRTGSTRHRGEHSHCRTTSAPRRDPRCAPQRTRRSVRHRIMPNRPVQSMSSPITRLSRLGALQLSSPIVRRTSTIAAPPRSFIDARSPSRRPCSKNCQSPHTS